MQATIMMLGVLSAVVVSGCGFLAGTAIGAAGAGGAYEYQHKQELDELDREFEQGKITHDEYLQRKKDIEDSSVVY